MKTDNLNQREKRRLARQRRLASGVVRNRNFREEFTTWANRMIDAQPNAARGARS